MTAPEMAFWISPETLSARLGTPRAPPVIDVRRREAFETSEHVIAASIWASHDRSHEHERARSGADLLPRLAGMAKNWVTQFWWPSRPDRLDASITRRSAPLNKRSPFDERRSPSLVRWCMRSRFRIAALIHARCASGSGAWHQAHVR